jgi:iron complex outermembrane receptor protein
MKIPIKLAGCLLLLCVVSSEAGAQEPEPRVVQKTDLASMNIEDLMNVKVTSVSAKEQKLSRTAAAVFVITQEDIRRSGATNIPHLLRMVPGVDVAQVNSNTWAVSARGLNDEFSDEMLVLLDGRNVYTPTFGGVFWDLLDLPLENIDRIEVIRGPGGSTWGTNAVNGVISIITKKADQTRGGLVVAGGGNIDQGFGTLQYGDRLGKGTDFRVYSKYFIRDDLPSFTGQDGGDGWHLLRGGFRTDSTLSIKDTLMFQGDVFTGKEGDSIIFLPSITSPGLLNIPTQAGQSGGSLQSVWKHAYSPHSDSTLNASYSTYKSEAVLNAVTEERKTLNIEFQHHVAWGARQDFVWGLGYAYSTSRSVGNLAVSLNPRDLNAQLFSSFIQDEIALVPDRVYLTVGGKLEHNYYTGFAVMPSVRVTFSPSAHHMAWAAVSRAVSSPTATDTSIRLNFGSSPGPGGTPILSSLLGNPRFQNEDLLAYEMGYRTTVSTRLSVDVAAFYNDYDNQQTIEPAAEFLETTPPPVHFVMPSTYENLMQGESHGFEITANWKLTKRWTISPAYDFERFHMHVSTASKDTGTVPDTEGNDPHINARLRSHVDLSNTLAWDTSAYFVDRITFQGVPSYTRLDTGLSWRCREGLSLSLVGQNLIRDHHIEFVESTLNAESSSIKRSTYAKVTWRF